MSKLCSVVASCNHLGGRDSTRDYALINESGVIEEDNSFGPDMHIHACTAHIVLFCLCYWTFFETVCLCMYVCMWINACVSVRIYMPMYLWKPYEDLGYPALSLFLNLLRQSLTKLGARVVVSKQLGSLCPLPSHSQCWACMCACDHAWLFM